MNPAYHLRRDATCRCEEISSPIPKRTSNENSRFGLSLASGDVSEMRCSGPTNSQHSGTGLRTDRGSHRQPFSIDNDMGPVGTTETEAEDDVPECDDEADDDIEINSDLAKDTTEARRITNE